MEVLCRSLEMRHAVAGVHQTGEVREASDRRVMEAEMESHAYGVSPGQVRSHIEVEATFRRPSGGNQLADKPVPSARILITSSPRPPAPVLPRRYLGLRDCGQGPGHSLDSLLGCGQVVQYLPEPPLRLRQLLLAEIRKLLQ